MTTPETGGKQTKKSRAEKKAQAAHPSGIEKLKAVVRRLPPNLPEEIFWQSVQPWVTDDSASWRAFYPGKIRKKYNKENIPSRAYIAFRSAEHLAAFSQSYDGHVFRDKAGNESFAVVEFAPFQKIPSEKRKNDPRMGTIEQDEDFISFMETLNSPTSKPSETDTIEALIAASQPPPQPKSTPLLDALRAEKQAQRDRETILKAHAHYREHKGELGGRRKGKQAQVTLPIGQEDTAAVPGHGKRSRRGKKGDATVAAAQGKAKGKDPALATSPKAPAKTAVKPAVQQAPFAGSKENAKDGPQERRARPAIGIGLASRQFEAALAGAGVLPGPDRKSRRERAREKKTGDIMNVEDAQKGQDKVDKVEKPQHSASPVKEPAKSGRKRGDSTKSSNTPAASGTSGSILEKGTTPTILPRPGAQPGILARPPPGPSDAPASSQAPSGHMSKQGGGGQAAGEGRGGRRRGRGRGSARGAAVAAGS